MKMIKNIKEFKKELNEKYPKSSNEIEKIFAEIKRYYRTKSENHYIKYKDYYKNKAAESYERNKEKVKKRTAINCDLKRFGGQRQFILERDNFTCQECGMTNEQHIIIFGKSLTIHHIDGKGSNSKNPNNNPNNLQTLCLRCHGIKDQKRSKPIKKGGIKI